ncbi:hypothetical protein ARNL5_01119 [Anaerolineae bacterium]|nr:hypothetical protein ARNL5_01119 [Anaerolineae bacterium]
MVARLRIELSPAQAQELKSTRDNHTKAYMRERASAVLKVAAGESARQVAEQGLLKRHEPETVSLWIRQYLAAGLTGWAIKTGRGRKPKFFPPQP